ncbi:MAG: hypothetical protein HY815_11110 [Candidatus Riflebacteria bacterium]|nr:hypothetical protein [Candidatus Riflebacteria bacterium]
MIRWNPYLRSRSSILSRECSRDLASTKNRSWATSCPGEHRRSSISRLKKDSLSSRFTSSVL